MINGGMIEVKDLHKSYKDVAVLKGVNLSVERGQIYALLGSNGAGKTTIIKILSTLLKPDSGKVKLAVYDVVLEAEEVKKLIALTGQYTAVDDILTGRENLNMMGSLLNVSNKKAKIDDLLEQFELTQAAERQVLSYSGGMRRKLDIAMSLIGEPSIIFLDEPTTGLDPQSRMTMWAMIKELSKQGVTIFLTTQYLDEAEVLADKIAILNNGRIVAEGSNDELKDIIAINHITITFKSQEEVQKAKLVLREYSPKVNNRTHTISIETQSLADELMSAFTKLTTAGIEVVNFEKKKASLEDVFLEIIKNEEAVNVYDVAGF